MILWDYRWNLHGNFGENLMPKKRSFTREDYKTEAYRRLQPLFELLMKFGDQDIHIEGGQTNIFSQLPRDVFLPDHGSALAIKSFIDKQIEQAKQASPILARYGFEVKPQVRAEGTTLLFIYWPVDIRLMNESLTMKQALRQMNGEDEDEE